MITTSEILVCVDSGKKNTKGLIEVNADQYRDVFYTSILDATNRTKINNSVFEVEYDGKVYHVGGGEQSEFSFSHTKLLEEHKLCIYTMVANLFEKARLIANGENIALSINVPLAEYLDKDRRKEYVDFFIKDKKVEITLNGVTHKFNISRVVPNYESGGSLLRYSHKYENETVLVMDNGGRDTTICLYNSLRPDRNYAGSFELGFNTLFNKVKQLVETRLNLKLSNQHITDIIERKDTKTLNFEEMELVNNIIKRQFNEALLNIRGAGIDVNRIPLLITGGTTDIYAPFIPEAMPNGNYNLSSTGLYDNVDGFMLQLKAALGR